MNTEAASWVQVRTAVILLVYFLYEPVLTATATTLGQKLFGVRVRDEKTLQRISFLRAFPRALIKFFLGWISLLVVPSSKNRQAIHDMAVGSVVIYVKAAERN